MDRLKNVFLCDLRVLARKLAIASPFGYSSYVHLRTLAGPFGQGFTWLSYCISIITEIFLDDEGWTFKHSYLGRNVAKGNK